MVDETSPLQTGYNSSDMTEPSANPDDNQVDQQFRALLEGLRTSLPGVQVLFAFLLTAPLQSQFSDLSNVETVAFAVAFYSSAVASALLIAPSVHQRMRAPDTGLRRQSKRHLAVATWVTIIGTVAMGLAILSTVFLVSSLVFESTFAAFATLTVSLTLGWSWFYLPLISFRSGTDEARGLKRG